LTGELWWSAADAAYGFKQKLVRIFGLNRISVLIYMHGFAKTPVHRIDFLWLKATADL